MSRSGPDPGLGVEQPGGVRAVRSARTGQIASRRAGLLPNRLNPVSLASSDQDLNAAMGVLDDAFREGDAAKLAAMFTEDAQLLTHESSAVVGRPAIQDFFLVVFDQFDTSAYSPEYELAEVHGDRAYAIGSFEEVLRSRQDQTGLRVHGRVVYFWRRSATEGWQVAYALTGRSAPDKPL